MLLAEKTNTIKDDFDSVHFVPALYNKTYYSTVMQDEAALIKWQSGPLQKFLKKYLKSKGITTFPVMFDVGCGPAVHHLFSLAKYSDSLHLADFMPPNIAEIQKWVTKKPDAHDWGVFVSTILNSEKVDPTPKNIALREQEVRNKIVTYSTLNLKKRVISVWRQSAPFVTSYFVADSATRSKNVFNKMTKNAFEIVAPGGVFVAAYLGGCARYRIGRRWFACANVSKKDIRLALEKAGAKKVKIWRFNTPEMKNEGFDHIFAAIAEK